MRWMHYWLAIAIMIVSALNLYNDEELKAIYDLLLVIVNLMFATYWQREEK